MCIRIQFHTDSKKNAAHSSLCFLLPVICDAWQSGRPKTGGSLKFTNRKTRGVSARI